MIEAVLFITGASILYTNILKCTSGKDISEDSEIIENKNKRKSLLKKSLSCFSK